MGGGPSGPVEKPEQWWTRRRPVLCRGRLPREVSCVILDVGGGYYNITVMIEDTELLRRYAEDNAEDAFAELVRRRVGLVYGVALRRTRGDAQAAQDATQEVFADLARKAVVLSRRPVLAGWLYRSAQFAAADIMRTERRRHARQQEALRMQEIERQASEPNWDELRPVLDELLTQMDDRDRDAVLLRFFDGRPFAEIGARIRLSENAARMRVERALEKLRIMLERRGVVSTTSALGLALANQAAAAAPAGLATVVTGAALGGGTTVVVAGAALFMGMTKLQLGIAGAVGLAGAAGFVSQMQRNDALRRELAAFQQQPATITALRAENGQLARVAAEVEMLRRDDVELQQLAQSVAEAQRVSQENARQAQLHAAQNRRRQLETNLREKDRLAQLEVDRLNREGNMLVGEYKELAKLAKEPSLTAEARVQADVVVKAKLATIQAKQREVQDFIKETRQSLMQEAAELRSLAPELFQGPNPPGSFSGPGRLELRRSVPEGSVSVPGEIKVVQPR